MILKKKATNIFVLFMSLYIGALLVLPTISLAYEQPKDKSYSVSGISKSNWPTTLQNYRMTCGNVLYLLEEIEAENITTLPNHVLHYENLYEYQCLGKTIEEHSIYERPYDYNSKVTGGQSCGNLQETLITTLFDNESEEDSLDPVSRSLYINQCVIAPVGWKDRNPMNEDRGIPLMAPLPIEGGDYIENTNKTYIYSYLVKLYKFVIGIAGIVAVGELVLAGFGIALAAGDTGKVENSKKRLIQTLEGLGLLFTTAIILNTINPVAYNFETPIIKTRSFNTDELSSLLNQINADNYGNPGEAEEWKGYRESCDEGDYMMQYDWYIDQKKQSKPWNSCVDRGPGVPGDSFVVKAGAPWLGSNEYRLNYKYRGPITPTALVLHYTAGSTFQAAKDAMQTGQYVYNHGLACHLVVEKNGKAYQMMDSLDEMSACQAGINSNAIGVEIIGLNETDLLTNSAQIAKVKEIVEYITGAYSIPKNNIEIMGKSGVFSHMQVCKKLLGDECNGKIDPGEDFMRKILNEIDGGSYVPWQNS